MPISVSRQMTDESSGKLTISERQMPNGSVIEVRSGHLPDGSFIQTFTDITKRREAEAYVARLASEDPLTGLANRRVFRSTLESICAKAGRRPAAQGRGAVHRSGSLQDHQRHARPSRRRPAAAGGGGAAARMDLAGPYAGAARRRRIRDHRAESGIACGGGSARQETRSLPSPRHSVSTAIRCRRR